MYLWLKALHVIAVIAWMAGMLYLPRLFVYHCDAPPGSQQSETFKTMERRLLRFIMTPALLAAWGFGIVLALDGQWAAAKWFQTKFMLVLVMTAMHGLFARWASTFADDRNRHTAKFFRIVNEIPTLLLITIVILAVVKPF